MNNSANYQLKYPNYPVEVAEHKGRFCLKCDKKFRSIGPQNRLCVSCANVNSRYDNDVTSDGHKRVSSGSSNVYVPLEFGGVSG